MATSTPEHRWTKAYAGPAGFYGRAGLSRFVRPASATAKPPARASPGFSDRQAARASLDRVLGADADAMIIGHVTHVRSGAKEALAAAYAWLG